MACVGKFYPISYLPNNEGFEFIAIYENGNEKKQVVKKRDNGIHYIDNFKQIKGWRRYYGEV